ncbi:MAG: N-acetylmuramic acid 6-phosphate etherase [Chthoniobacterales bacterium]|nr:N-acetylmuramic acid 6-phosphate etherase [Chthoniobacterales bacterium]
MTSTERILGLEGGGTKSKWVLLERSAGALRQTGGGKLPAANLRLTSRERLQEMLAELPRDLQRAGVFLAGCVTAEDRRTLAEICARIWADAKIVTGGDRESGIAAALGDRDGIVVNAGTGSSVTGRIGDTVERAAGWGHILGDSGGGYYLSLQTLRLVLREHDLHRGDAELAADILHALCLNDLDALVRWAQSADKMQIATLAPAVFKAAEAGNERVHQIVHNGARRLAEYTAAVAERLKVAAPEVFLVGGLFQSRELYAATYRDELSRTLPAAMVQVSAHAPEYGAAWLAAEAHANEVIVAAVAEPMPAETLATAATEQRNARSLNLDQLSTREIVELFVQEEACVQEALGAAAAQIAEATELVANTLRTGGRLFYVGAGTSGRLGVLDATEMPPTFGTTPEMVQGIIAGGAAALTRSVEGAEDDAAAASVAVQERGVRAGDVVCGIAASGRTPFVLAALTRSKQVGARTILLTCNPGRPSIEPAPDVAIDLATGPELLTGSTRLKAGTATKVALNIISTGAMIALGKVRGNLMIDVAVTNVKLRDRAIRLVAELASCSYGEAVERLERANWVPRAAVS